MKTQPELRLGKSGAPNPRYWGANSQDREHQLAQAERRLRAALDGMSLPNRLDVEAFLRRRNRKKKFGRKQAARYADLLGQLDKHTAATPWRDVTATQLDAFFEHKARAVSHGTKCQIAVLLKGFFRWLFAMQDHLLPPSFQEVLDTGEAGDDKRQRLIPDAHVLAILNRARADFMMQALLMTLYDTGFRISEALSLNIGDVEFAPHDGTPGVWLRLPKENPRYFLKTGPRDVWVAQCVPALKQWLSVHPFGDRADAPLFLSRLGHRAGDGSIRRGAYVPLGPNKALRTLKSLCREASVPDYVDHDFRHTKAYWCKKRDWADSKMCTFLGWSDGSKKPREYGRLVAADLRDDVRRDLGTNNLGQLVVSKEGEAEAKLKILQEAFRLALDPTARTPAARQGGVSFTPPEGP